MIGCSTESSNEQSKLARPKALADEEKYEEAYQEFNKLATGDDLSNIQNSKLRQRLEQLTAYICLANTMKPVDLYNNFMTQFSDSQWVENALYGRGLCYYGLQNYEAAHSSFTESLERFPNSQFKEALQKFIKESFLETAKALANDGKYREAYKEFNRLANSDELKNYPELQAEATFRTYHSLQMLGKYDEAVDLYNNFMTQFSGSQWVENALYGRGTLLL